MTEESFVGRKQPRCYNGPDMGTFSHPITISDLNAQRTVTLEAQVDTRATYLVLPTNILRELSVESTARRRFRLADGRSTKLPAADVLLHLDGEADPVLCVFAPEGTMPRLDAVPLETFGLAVDPVQKRLVRVASLLLALS
jgi:predicted aspartyl protease